jgi:hypothetical protein
LLLPWLPLLEDWLPLLEDWLPALDDWLPALPWLPWELLDGLLLEELLDGLLLEELLLDELLLELLLEELLLEGALVLGVEGVWGVVGLLALGQPVRSRQAQTTSGAALSGAALSGAAASFENCAVLFDLIGPYNLLCVHGFPFLKSRSKAGLA